MTEVPSNILPQDEVVVTPKMAEDVIKEVPAAVEAIVVETANTVETATANTVETVVVEPVENTVHTIESEIPVIQGEVVATGVAVTSHIEALGPYLEQKMVDAINWCYANGITAPEQILAKKMEALEAGKAAYAAAVAAQ